VPVSRPSVPESAMEIKPEEIIMHLDSRRWRARGLGKNMSYEQLKLIFYSQTPFLGGQAFETLN